MPTFNSSIYSAQAGTAGASLNAQAAYPLAKNAFGKLRIVQVPYTIAGTEATNDVINLCVLKNGDRVVAGLSRVVGQAAGTAFTIKVGDTNDSARYCTGLALAAGGVFEFGSTAGTDRVVPSDVVVPVPPVSSTDQSVVKATLTTVTTPTAGAKLLFLLAVVAE